MVRHRDRIGDTGSKIGAMEGREVARSVKRGITGKKARRDDSTRSEEGIGQETRDMQGDQRVRKAEIGRDTEVEVRDVRGIGTEIDGETIVIVIAVETGIGTVSVTVGTEDAIRLVMSYILGACTLIYYILPSHKLPTFPALSLPSRQGRHAESFFAWASL